MLLMGIAYGPFKGYIQLLASDCSLCTPLSRLHCLPAAWGGKEMPDPPGTATGEQPQLSVARLPLYKIQHDLRIGASDPFGLRHRLILHPRGTPRPSTVTRACPVHDSG